MAAYFQLESGKRLSLVARHNHPVLSNRVTVVASAEDNNPIDSLDEFLDLIREDRRLVQWLLPVLDSQSRWVLFKHDEQDVPRALGHFWVEPSAQHGLQHYRGKYRDSYFWLELAEPFHNNYRV